MRICAVKGCLGGRGLVSTIETFFSLEMACDAQFKDKFGENPRREDMMIRAEREHDANDLVSPSRGVKLSRVAAVRALKARDTAPPQIMVFFPDDEKVGVKTIKARAATPALPAHTLLTPGARSALSTSLRSPTAFAVSGPRSTDAAQQRRLPARRRPAEYRNGTGLRPQLR